MPNGGRLAIRTYVTPASVVVKVIDSGIGMDEETRQRCLDPFYTTKGKRGTGLGLAMVYGTLQRHSARIDIASAVGYGTAIRLTFPLPPPSTESTLLPSFGAVFLPPPVKILVVDDDPLLRQSLCDILQGDGHEVVVADGGEAGIEAFLAALNSRTFHVVITDLGMPEIDGRELARCVKTRSPTTPVILLTGWGRQMTSEGEVPPYVDCLLSKPPTIEDLRKALVLVSAQSGEERSPNGIA
jgi:CheY-like chemotaxis protein